MSAPDSTRAVELIHWMLQWHSSGPITPAYDMDEWRKRAREFLAAPQAAPSSTAAPETGADK